MPDIDSILYNPKNVQYLRQQVDLITKLGSARKVYAESIYKKIVENSLFIQKFNTKTIPSNPSDPKSTPKTFYLDRYREHNLKIIESFLRFEESWFILHDPSTGKPSVLTYIYDVLSEGYSESDYAATLANYREEMEDESTSSVYKAIKRGKTVTAKASEYGGKFLEKRGSELAEMAERMASRPGKREVTRHLPNAEKTAALGKLAEKYAKTAAQSKALLKSAKVLGSIAKFAGSRTVGIAIDAFTPYELADTTITGRDKAVLKIEIERKLSEYCQKNYNFHMLQQTQISPQ